MDTVCVASTPGMGGCCPFGLLCRPVLDGTVVARVRIRATNPKRTFLAVVALALVVSAETVSATDFTDPAARVFTLVPNGTVTAMTALPNGDVVSPLKRRAVLHPAR